MFAKPVNQEYKCPYSWKVGRAVKWTYFASWNVKLFRCTSTKNNRLLLPVASVFLHLLFHKSISQAPLFSSLCTGFYKALHSVILKSASYIYQEKKKITNTVFVSGFVPVVGLQSSSCTCNVVNGSDCVIVTFIIQENERMPEAKQYLQSSLYTIFFHDTFNDQVQNLANSIAPFQEHDFFWCGEGRPNAFNNTVFPPPVCFIMFSV